MTRNSIPVWKKELFHRQPFPDNYSGGDECFLNEMRKNVSAVKYSLGSAILAACHLMAHINAVLLYFLLFEGLHEESIQYDAVLWCFVLLSSLTYLFYHTCLSTGPWRVKEHVKVLGTLLVFGYALTPIIRTLTTTISTDTIYALALIFAAISCIFHDYGIKAPIVSAPLSVSSGLSSAVLLISRLESSPPAFLLLSIAFTLHSHLPLICNELVLTRPFFEAIICGFLSVSSLYSLFIYEPILSALWLFVLIFVVVMCPLLLVSLQHRKSTIHGPWDEAVPARSASDLLR